jgi:hypothetical protein
MIPATANTIEATIRRSIPLPTAHCNTTADSRVAALLTSQLIGDTSPGSPLTSHHCSGLTLGDTSYDCQLLEKYAWNWNLNSPVPLFRVDIQGTIYKLLQEPTASCFKRPVDCAHVQAGSAKLVFCLLKLSFEPIVESLVQTHQGRFKVIQAASHNQQAYRPSQLLHLHCIPFPFKSPHHLK